VAGISVRNIRKRYRDVQALDGISFDVELGEVVALLGPNGAGKSTLIRILAGTVLADDGSATVAGHDVAGPAARRSLGLMLGDERSHYWRLSGRRNLAFFAALAGLSRREGATQAQRLLEEVELAEAADRPVLGYSSGMRARLSLARALIADPPVLLFDEPTRNLDPLAASRFRETTTHLASARRAGILFATHNLQEAVAIADRILVFSAGRLVLEEEAHGTDPVRLEAAFIEAVQSRPGNGDLTSYEVLA
jgi:ABC-type multidrug transport system ATPase subunit